MDIELTKQFLLACHTAKHICESMPELPPGLKPRHIRIIDTIHQLEHTQDVVRISDVSHLMNSTTPSITKLIRELVDLGYVEKIQQTSDRRVFAVQLTASGENIYQHFVYEFHHWLNDRLSDLSPNDMATTIRIIKRIAEEIRPIKQIFSTKE